MLGTHYDSGIGLIFLKTDKMYLDPTNEPKMSEQAHVSIAALEEGGELGVEVVGERDVGEHAVELVGELVAARLLQPVDHRLLQIHRMRLLVDEAFAWRTETGSSESIKSGHLHVRLIELSINFDYTVNTGYCVLQIQS
jgi:hypothetical protein